MGMIFNPKNVEIQKKEIYNDVIEYRLPEGWYFESNGFSYGNRIYGTVNLSNYYTVKKKEDNETDTNKDSK